MPETFLIGANLSSSGGYEKMIETAHSIDGNTVQYFTRNPRGGDARPRNYADEEKARKLLDLYGIAHESIIAHAPYTMNPCSQRPEIRDFTVRTMREDIETLESCPGILYNFHPGSHTGQGADVGIEYTAHCLAEVMTPDIKTHVLIETMAGKGSEIGKTFDEVRAIIDLAENENPSIKGMIGVCMDTCHVYDAGYDIVGDLDGVVDEFDRIIGLDRLYAIHLNDSKNPFSSHKDRHECIGKGSIGLDAMLRIINHPKLRSLPFCLETPNEVEGYADEIRLLRSGRSL